MPFPLSITPDICRELTGHGFSVIMSGTFGAEILEPFFLLFVKPRHYRVDEFLCRMRHSANLAFDQFKPACNLTIEDDLPVALHVFKLNGLPGAYVCTSPPAYARFFGHSYLFDDHMFIAVAAGKRKR